MASILSAGTTTSTSLVASADTTGILQLATNNGTVAVTIGTNQNVGIGTTTPATVGVSGYTRLVLGAGASTTDGLTIVPSATGGIQFTDAATIEKGYIKWNSSTGALTFGTAATERVRITAAGDVGIGTNNPQAQIHAYSGDIMVGNGASVLSRMFRAVEVGIAGNNAGITFGGTGSKGAIWGQSGTGGMYIVGSSNGGGSPLNFGYSASDTSLSANYSSLGVWNTTGLGIGTTSPGRQLEVYSASAVYAKINSATTAQSALQVTNGGGNFYVGIDTSTGGAFAAGAYGRVLYSDGAYPMVFYTSSSERMRIDSSGNVGIGTTVNNVYDQVAAARPLVVQKSDTSTTLNGSTAAITIVNGDTTTNNLAQLNFAAITGASTNQYTAATISAIFGARTNTQYPTGQLVFSTSTTLNSAPSEKARIDSTGAVLVNTTTALTGAKLSVTGGISGVITSGTVVTLAAQTNVDFTGIPSWVKRITVMFGGVSTSGTSNIIIQLGTGATPTYTTSGYLGTVANQAGTVETFTSGFTIVPSQLAASVWHGNIVINNVTSNTWSESSFVGNSNAAGTRGSGGSIPLAAALTAVRITTANGTDTFDLGSINILYEG